MITTTINMNTIMMTTTTIRHRTVRCTAASRHTLARVPPLTQVGWLFSWCLPLWLSLFLSLYLSLFWSLYLCFCHNKRATRVGPLTQDSWFVKPVCLPLILCHHFLIFLFLISWFVDSWFIVFEPRFVAIVFFYSLPLYFMRLSVYCMFIVCLLFIALIFALVLSLLPDLLPLYSWD